MPAASDAPVGRHGGWVVADAEAQIQRLVRRPARAAVPAGERGQHAIADRARRDQPIPALSAHAGRCLTSGSRARRVRRLPRTRPTCGGCAEPADRRPACLLAVGAARPRRGHAVDPDWLARGVARLGRVVRFGLRRGRWLRLLVIAREAIALRRPSGRRDGRRRSWRARACRAAAGLPSLSSTSCWPTPGCATRCWRDPGACGQPTDAAR